MEDGKPNEIGTSGTETNTNSEEDNKDPEINTAPKGIVEQAKEEREKTEKLLVQIRAENDRTEKLRSEQILGGEVGGNVKVEPKKEETPKEYRDRIDKEISEGKHGD